MPEPANPYDVKPGQVWADNDPRSAGRQVTVVDIIDGWMLLARDGLSSVIVSAAPFDGAEWVHASRTGQDRVPTYDELMQLHRAVWGTDGYSYQVQAPAARHVNIHPHALHLWGRADGARVLPDFGKWGSI